MLAYDSHEISSLFSENYKKKKKQEGHDGPVTLTWAS